MKERTAVICANLQDFRRFTYGLRGVVIGNPQSGRVETEDRIYIAINDSHKPRGIEFHSFLIVSDHGIEHGVYDAVVSRIRPLPDVNLPQAASTPAFFSPKQSVRLGRRIGVQVA